MRQYDVVVLGAGPAGGAAARLLAGWGHAVLLVDRAGGRPPLAESLPPSCISLLEATGLREAVDAAGFVRATGNTVWWGGGSRRVEPFPGGALGYQVLSARLDDVVREQAARAGATVLRPATVTGVTRTDDGHAVHLTGPAGPETVGARWVLDATGRAGLLARSRRAPGALRTVAIVGEWERRGGWGLPDETHTLVESAPWGWGWSVPVSESRRFVTVMLDPAATPLAAGPDLAARYRDLLGALPAMGELADGATLAGPPWACDATPYAGDPVPAPRALAIGDAASGIDPLSSFGVKKALASAWLGAVATHTAMVSPGDAEAAIELYTTRERAYVAGATRELGVLSREAIPGEPGAFWGPRATLDADESDAASGARWRDDAGVRAAFEALRTRPAARLVRAPGLAVVRAPLVRGNVVVREDHLRLRGAEAPMRYLRNVDLLLLLDIATRNDDVGAMYEEYVRRHGPVSLPDVLGALAVLLASGALDFA